VPALQFAQIQTRRVTVIRRPAENVRAAAGTLHVLLAKVLLVYIARRNSAIEQRLLRVLKHHAQHQRAIRMSISFIQNALSHGKRVKPSVMPPWLTHMGIFGLFFVSIVDSSAIPLPIPGSTDLLLLWLVAHSGNPWLLTPCAVAGSIIGGYTTWQIGRKGGETALQHYVPARLLKRVVRWVERHPVLSVFVPTMLPPPIPLSPFVLASGALSVSRGRFLVVFGAARALRYSLVAWLAVAYGRRVVSIWSGTLQKWSTPLLCVFVGLMVAGVGFGIWKVRAVRKSDAAKKPSSRTSRAHAG
jgi:membrane protein YqaA with SNARE-associated domain